MEIWSLNRQERNPLHFAVGLVADTGLTPMGDLKRLGSFKVNYAYWGTPTSDAQVADSTDWLDSYERPADIDLVPCTDGDKDKFHSRDESQQSNFENLWSELYCLPENVDLWAHGNQVSDAGLVPMIHFEECTDEPYCLTAK